MSVSLSDALESGKVSKCVSHVQGTLLLPLLVHAGLWGFFSGLGPSVWLCSLVVYGEVTVYFCLVFKMKFLYIIDSPLQTIR